MNLSAFPLHFLRPWWWLALAPLPLVLWVLARGGGGRAVLARLADAALLPSLIHDTGARRRVALALAAVTWLLAVVALTGPAWQRIETPLYVSGAARVVALSLSNDMLAQDLKPDRLTQARFAVHDLLESAGDARTALVAYAGAAFTVAPLTNDKRTVLNLLRALQPNVMPVQGNDAAAGIAQSVQLLRNAQVRGGEIVLVADNAGAAAVVAARKAHAQGIRVDVLGIGTRQGAPVPKSGGGFAGNANGTLLARRNDAALRAVASAGGGSYAILSSDGRRTPVFSAPVATAGHTSADQRARIWRDGGIWLLPALVLLAALAFRRGWLLVIAILVMPIAMPTAHAERANPWWMNRNQRAVSALQHGNAKQAQQLATNPGVRGSADYRAGDYAEAAKAFAQGQGARAHYNLGNALAKTGKYRKAIAAYDEALKLDPKLADARANRKAVRQWLAKHAKPPKSGSSGQTDQHSRHSRGAGKSKRQAGQPSSQSAQSKTEPSGKGGPGSSSGAKQGGNPANAGQGSEKQQSTAGASNGAQSAKADSEKQASQALRRELSRQRGKPTSSASHAFALGQNQVKPHSKLNAQQRALLRAVPDDPGALLRRKFRLEWQRRQGQAQGGGS